MAVINPYVMPTSPTVINPITPTVPTQVPVLQNQQSNGGTIVGWTQGINGAKAYPLGPNTRAYLFDTEVDKFYTKNTDASGVPQPVREFEYFEVEHHEEESMDPSNYVTKAEFDSMSDKLDSILEQLQNVRSYRKENKHGQSVVRGANESRS